MSQSSFGHLGQHIDLCNRVSSTLIEKEFLSLVTLTWKEIGEKGPNKPTHLRFKNCEKWNSGNWECDLYEILKQTPASPQVFMVPGLEVQPHGSVFY